MVHAHGGTPPVETSTPRRRNQKVVGGGETQRPSDAVFSSVDVLRLQATAGNASVAALLSARSASASLQRQPDAGAPPQAPAADAGAGPAPPPAVSVEQLAREIGAQLSGTDVEEKKRAVERLNSGNVYSIAATLRLLQASGHMNELTKHAPHRPLVEVSVKAHKDPLSITEADMAKVHEAQRGEFAAQWSISGLSVPNLVLQVSALLMRARPEDKYAAVWRLDMYSVKDIAAALKMLEAGGHLDELTKYASHRGLIEVAIKAYRDPLSVMDADMEKVPKDRRFEFRKQFHVVEESFLPTLEKVATALGCAPDVLLAPMMSESGGGAKGLAPEAMNPESQAVGLIQFMPDTLKKLEFKGGADEFAQKTATEQLEFVQKYFAPAANKLKSSGRVYQFMFLPSTMDKATAPGDAITWANHPDADMKKAYDKNQKALDTNKDGKITLGELEALAAGHSHDARALLSRLRARRGAPKDETEIRLE